jgi:carboxylate-amine ligase
MSESSFQRNDWPTLGVEVELQLVDAQSLALKSAIGDILAEIPEDLRESVKPEFMQCYVELNTDVCRTVDEVEGDLDWKVRVVEEAADRCGTRLVWAGTHPFSRWQEQEITPDERYYRLADLLRETVVRPVTFGLHVHVGVDSGDKAIGVGQRLLEHLPLLLALSANSPFWHGRLTGYHAHRVEILEAFPTGGLPPALRSWAEYEELVGQLKTAGFIESHRELWWDVRPNAINGTVEVRICDMPPNLPDLLGLTALIQCLVCQLSDAINRGEPAPESHPLMLKQNRWRASRFGLGAELVDTTTLEAVPAPRAAERMARRLAPFAERLGCSRHLERVRDMANRATGAERQIAFFEQTGDLAEVVRRMIQQSRLGREPVPSPVVPVLPPASAASYPYRSAVNRLNGWIG